MISFMENTMSSKMADHSEDFIMKRKMQFFLCFLKFPNGRQIYGQNGQSENKLIYGMSSPVVLGIRSIC